MYDRSTAQPNLTLSILIISYIYVRRKHITYLKEKKKCISYYKNTNNVCNVQMYMHM